MWMLSSVEAVAYVVMSNGLIGGELAIDGVGAETIVER